MHACRRFAFRNVVRRFLRAGAAPPAVSHPSLLLLVSTDPLYDGQGIRLDRFLVSLFLSSFFRASSRLRPDTL